MPRRFLGDTQPVPLTIPDLPIDYQLPPIEVVDTIPLPPMAPPPPTAVPAVTNSSSNVPLYLLAVLAYFLFA